MKNLICILLFLSQSLCAGTIITGSLAETLYNLIPNKPVRHYAPRLMDVKAPAMGLHCAKRFNEQSLDYKCLLPNKDEQNNINIVGEAAQVLYEALFLHQENTNNDLKKINCTSPYHCIVRP